MKKQYRTVAWLALFLPAYILTIPFALIGIVCDWELNMATEYKNWLTRKLRVSK